VVFITGHLVLLASGYDFEALPLKQSLVRFLPAGILVVQKAVCSDCPPVRYVE
jgi:hypothetical protein